MLSLNHAPNSGSAPVEVCYGQTPGRTAPFSSWLNFCFGEMADEVRDEANQPPRWRKTAGTLIATFVAAFVGWKEAR